MQYDEYDKGKYMDFSICSYEEWIRFLFEQELRTEPGESPFHDYEFVNQFALPGVYVKHLTRLFHDLPNLVEKYGLAQIDQGLWGISIGIFFGPSINQLLWDSTVPMDSRIECIRAMRLIYSEVVAIIPNDVDPGTAFEKWWDNVCLNHDFEPEAARDLVYKMHILPILLADEPVSSQVCLQNIKALKGQLDPELKYDFDSWTESDITDFWKKEKPIIDAAFETLKEILELGERLRNWRCQYYALHGLGHLQHPKKPALVQSYTDRHREEWDQGDLEWLEACRDGSVM